MPLLLLPQLLLRTLELVGHLAQLERGEGLQALEGLLRLDQVSMGRLKLSCMGALDGAQLTPVGGARLGKTSLERAEHGLALLELTTLCRRVRHEGVRRMHCQLPARKREQPPLPLRPKHRVVGEPMLQHVHLLAECFLMRGAIICNRMQSRAIRGTQRQSEALSAPARGVLLIRDTITCNHMQSHAITCNHMQSEALSAPARGADASRRARTRSPGAPRCAGSPPS